MKRWYMIAIRATENARCCPQEFLVQDKLNRLGIETFYPCERISKYFGYTPLTPGFLYVKINPNTYDYVKVKETGGVLDYIGFSAHPIAIPNELIAHFKGEVQMTTQDVKIGVTFKILNGAFTGFKGILTETRENSAVIAVNIFNSVINVPVSINDICMVTE